MKKGSFPALPLALLRGREESPGNAERSTSENRSYW